MRAILTYHSIDDSGSPISVSPQLFARHVEWLRSGRVRVTTVPELLTLPPATDAVAVTFDDAFRNFASEAAPRLEGLPVALFVVTGHVGGTNAWRGCDSPGIPTLPLLAWDELARLRERGVSLEAHSRTHPDLTALDGERLVDELAGAADRLQRETGVAPRGLAYPFGAVSRAVIEAAGRVYSWGCTTDLRTLGADAAPLALPRLDMYYFQQPGRLEAWGSAGFHAYLASRQLLRRTRQLAVRAKAAAAPGTRGSRP